jgi:CPA1 family monovalent cation:H+ antiporter
MALTKGAHMASCAHLEAAPLTPLPADFEPFCWDCAVTGEQWLHLRRCLQCDHLACCDSSPGKHASAHAHRTGHPVITSAEPGESWRWCFADEVGA